MVTSLLSRGSLGSSRTGLVNTMLGLSILMTREAMKSPLLSPSDCMTLVIVAYLIIYLLSLLRIELLNMSTMSLAHYNLSPKCLGDQRMAPRYVWMFNNLCKRDLDLTFFCYRN